VTDKPELKDQSEEKTPGQGRFVARMLGVVERVGNALPHPATLFASMAVLVVIASGVFHANRRVYFYRGGNIGHCLRVGRTNHAQRLGRVRGYVKVDADPQHLYRPLFFCRAVCRLF